MSANDNQTPQQKAAVAAAMAALDVAVDEWCQRAGWPNELATLNEAARGMIGASRIAHDPALASLYGRHGALIDRWVRQAFAEGVLAARGPQPVALTAKPGGGHEVRFCETEGEPAGGAFMLVRALLDPVDGSLCGFTWTDGAGLPFRIGQSVRKVGTGYQGPGVVRGITVLPDGGVRYQVGHVIEGGEGEFQHIYTVSQLSPV